MQYQLSGGWLVEADYVGTRGYDIGVNRDINAVPAPYLSAQRIRDDAVISSLTQQVNNPFRNLLKWLSVVGCWFRNYGDFTAAATQRHSRRFNLPDVIWA